MSRLTPPTNKTFVISLLAVIAGVVLSSEVGLVSGYDEISFYLLASGAGLLVLGVVFSRL